MPYRNLFYKELYRALFPNFPMQRRDFIQISTLGVAGLLAVRPDCQASSLTRHIALVYPERPISGYGDKYHHPASIVGAATMLRDSGIGFDITGQTVDFSRYRVLIFADSVLFSLSFKEKIETYLRRGGAVLASFKSGLTPDGARFATSTFGVERVGEARYSPDFIDTLGSCIGQNLASTELVMYERGMEVLPTDKTTILAHTQVPLAGAGSYPAATECGKVIYFMHPIFTQYHRTAPRWCRQLILNALDRLVPGIAEQKILVTPSEISL
jgi:hypothetical protein